MADSELEVGEDTGLDRETKSGIKRWVLGLRKQFEEDFALQLRRFGIDEKKDNGGPPEYLSEEEKTTRQRLLAVIRREEQAEPSRKQAIDAYIRDATFTYINRLVGLRCMEARELLYIDGEPAEVITIHGPTVHGGRPRLLAQMRDDNREYRNPDDGEERLWRDGLQCAFAAVTQEIGVLFDPEHDYSILFPSHAVLQEAVRAINEDLPSHVYDAPDFLGWVYQFFNADEKVEIRKETGGKPRTSHELAVINQFYTPDWIVKFLVDNTLGRIWLQMHPDTRLYWKNRIADRDPETMSPEEKAEVMFQGVNVDYLVPDTGEDEPIDAKPVAEITLLDPACGTMHFGQYACTLFYEMYLEEAEKLTAGEWDVGEATDPANIPTAILENNLFGVDIDPRAIQIAALAMLLTTKEQARLHGLDPQSVRVRDMNLVCADSVDLGEEQREKLLERLEPDVFGGPVPMRRAVEALWENLEHAGELGSLLQVDDSVERALSQVATWRMKFVDERQMVLGDEPEWGALQTKLTAEERTTARDYLLNELQSLAAGKGNGDVMAQLFAQETEKGLRLLAMLGRKYDAVVMNPPYGAFSLETRDISKELYPCGSVDIYAAFLERACSLAVHNGCVGMLTQRNFMFLSTFSDLRQDIIAELTQPLSILDLGFNVLDDATARYAASVYQTGRGRPVSMHLQACVFVRLIDPAWEEKHCSFVDALGALAAGMRSDCCFRVSLAQCNLIPGMPFSYWIPAVVRGAFKDYPPLDAESAGREAALQIAEAREGLGTRDNDRFLRQRWEVGPARVSIEGRKILRTAKWFPFVKGSSRYYTDLDTVVNWGDDGWEIRNYRTPSGKLKSRPQGIPYYFRPGVAWGCIVSGSSIEARPVGPGAIPGDRGRMFFPHEGDWSPLLVSWANSVLAAYLFRVLDPLAHDRAVGYVARLPVAPGILEADALAAMSNAICARLSDWDKGNELSSQFETPWILRALERATEHVDDTRPV